ncbi:MAG: isoprenylcysteine carboxylmethyltransferase family protein [Alphaproteobacteria bacterium]|nr:isoprenylcysteine carboxylmethyltransferase family protein [Alphaproteobacteria bacterium]
MASAAIARDLGAEREKRLALLLDFAERALVLVMIVGFNIRILPHYSESICYLLITVSEGVTAFMILIRRPGRTLNTVYGWSLAVLGTFAPLLVAPTHVMLVPSSVAAAIMTVGLFCAISAKIFLRRCFGIVPANRGVERDGPYKLVRHPIYLGYIIANVGFLSANASAWNAFIYASCWAAIVLRIRAEEEVLSTSPEYALYRAQVRCRLIPGIW